MIDNDWTWDPRDEAMVPTVTGRIARWARRAAERDDVDTYATTRYCADGRVVHTAERPAR